VAIFKDDHAKINQRAITGYFMHIACNDHYSVWGFTG